MTDSTRASVSDSLLELGTLTLGAPVKRSASDDEMSDLMKANLEALAERIPDCTSVCHQYKGWMCTRTYKGVTTTCVDYRKDF